MTALTVRVKVPLENFLPLLTGKHETTRTCSEDGCESPALYTKGYYLAGDRRVRVWVCSEHYMGAANTLLPTPPDIEYAFEQERKYLQARARKLRVVDAEKGISVKTLASTGAGKALPFDRVASFRWEPTPKKRRTA